MITSAVTIATPLKRYFMILILPFRFRVGRGISDTHPTLTRATCVNDARTVLRCHDDY
jgi:hypothetical protein